MSDSGVFNRKRIVGSPDDAADGFYEQLRAKEQLVRDQLREQLQAFLPPEQRDGKRGESQEPASESLEDFLARLDGEEDPLDAEVLTDSQETGYGTSSGSRATGSRCQAGASWFSHLGGSAQPGGRWRRGQTVVLQGLQHRSDLNGMTGELGRHNDETGRWQVLLTAGDSVWIRPANLEPRAPVPASTVQQCGERGATLTRQTLYGNWLVAAETDFVATVGEGGRTLYDGHYMGSDHNIDVFGSGKSIIIERSGGWAVDSSKSNSDLLVWARPGDEAVTWRRLREDLAEYLVDKSKLRAQGPGLAYRLSKQLEDRADDSEYAAWGSKVQGIDRGGTWVQVGLRFLPRYIGDVQVLLTTEEQEAAKQSAGDGGKAPADPVPVAPARPKAEEEGVLGYEELMAMLGEGEGEGEGTPEVESEVEEVVDLPTYDRDDPTVVSLIVLRVMSAGEPACNGAFHYESTHKGRPLFKSSRGAIVYFNQVWKMNACYKTTSWIYSAEDSKSQLPPTGTWTAQGSQRGDSEPPPNVQIEGQVLRIVSEKGPHLKLEDGRTVSKKDESKGWCRGAPFQ